MIVMSMGASHLLPLLGVPLDGSAMFLPRHRSGCELLTANVGLASPGVNDRSPS
jgi:hypothetical protein